jgi:hypothetical protein
MRGPRIEDFLSSNSYHRPIAESSQRRLRSFAAARANLSLRVVKWLFRELTVARRFYFGEQAADDIA